MQNYIASDIVKTRPSRANAAELTIVQIYGEHLARLFSGLARGLYKVIIPTSRRRRETQNNFSRGLLSFSVSRDKEIDREKEIEKRSLEDFRQGGLFWEYRRITPLAFAYKYILYVHHTRVRYVCGCHSI